MIHFSLDINEINRILGILGQAQYSQVADLIEKIKEQAVPQIMAQQEQNPQG
jgi:hypothetical protein